jgi:hypothetical protein
MATEKLLQDHLLSNSSRITGCCLSDIVDNLAALRANINIKIGFPPDPARNRPKTHDSLTKMAVRSLPKELPEGRQEQNKLQLG